LNDFHLAVQAALFRQITDAILRVAAVPVRPFDRPGIGIEDAGDHPYGGGLPGAVAAKEAGDRPLPDRKGNAVYCSDGAKCFNYIANRKDFRHAPPLLLWRCGVLYAPEAGPCGFGGSSWLRSRT